MQELEKILEELESHMFSAEVYNDDFDGTYINNLICLGDVREVLEDQVNEKWIPLEERLPEEGIPVLVWYEYFRYGEYNKMYRTYGIGWQYGGDWGGDVSGMNARCIAWRPLPEPYRPERSVRE